MAVAEILQKIVGRHKPKVDDLSYGPESVFVLNRKTVEDKEGFSRRLKVGESVVIYEAGKTKVTLDPKTPISANVRVSRSTSFYMSPWTIDPSSGEGKYSVIWRGRGGQRKKIVPGVNLNSKENEIRFPDGSIVAQLSNSDPAVLLEL